MPLVLLEICPPLLMASKQTAKARSPHSHPLSDERKQLTCQRTRGGHCTWAETGVTREGFEALGLGNRWNISLDKGGVFPLGGLCLKVKIQ